MGLGFNAHKWPNESFHRIGEERRSRPGELHVEAVEKVIKA
jgi:hypothetical protein